MSDRNTAILDRIANLERAVAANEMTLHNGAWRMIPSEREKYERTIKRQKMEIAGWRRMLV